jgi:hypothetical protein
MVLPLAALGDRRRGETVLFVGDDWSERYVRHEASAVERR